MDNTSSSVSGGTGTTGTGTPLLEQAKDQTQQVVQQAGQKAGQVMDQAREQVKTQLAGQKDRATDGLGTVASALRQTGAQLQNQGQATVSQYAEQAAQAIEGFSAYLRDKDVDDLVFEVENLARRQPTVFLGSAFALGFLAARFLKSSGQKAAVEQESGNGSQVTRDLGTSGTEAPSAPGAPTSYTTYEQSPLAATTPSTYGTGTADLGAAGTTPLAAAAPLAAATPLTTDASLTTDETADDLGEDTTSSYTASDTLSGSEAQR